MGVIVTPVTVSPILRRPDRRFLLSVYHLLRERYGHARWWPGESAFEVCLGAILTQNTSWSNVEKALGVLRRRGLLSFQALRKLPSTRIAPLIRSSGTYRVKARRIASFLAFLEDYGGRPRALARETLPEVRTKLLRVKGIGPETADSILLYAAGLPVFVIDAYTRRIFFRLGLLNGQESYAEIQALFAANLPRDAGLFNDYHAQIVRLGKEVCRTRPRCGDCPLEGRCLKRGL
jgi:endonuclease-3 related protein